jgi:hypothetical protein
VLEKPIGHDLAGARELDRAVSEVFEERQVFRIDHYLGKETVQNILAFRFANPMVERIWGGEAIEHVQLTVAESIGIEGRGSYYEPAGALRDMIQNHLLQVLSLLTMERPASLDPDTVHDAKAALLAAVRPFSPEEVVRGQYTWGVVEGEQALEADGDDHSGQEDGPEVANHPAPEPSDRRQRRTRIADRGQPHRTGSRSLVSSDGSPVCRSAFMSRSCSVTSASSCSRSRWRSSSELCRLVVASSRSPRGPCP